MNWFYIPNAAGNILTPQSIGSWPTIFTGPVTDTISVNLNLRGVALQEMDATHAISSFRHQNGSYNQIFARPLQIIGNNITLGPPFLIESTLNPITNQVMAKLSPTRFITGMTPANGIFVGNLVTTTNIITNAHGSLQNPAQNFNSIFTVNSNLILMSRVDVNSGNAARLINITGTTLTGTGLGANNLTATTTSIDSDSNGIYFAIIGTGFGVGRNNPRVTIYYYNGFILSSIASDMAITNMPGTGRTVHVLSNNMCVTIHLEDGNNITQFMTLYRLTPGGAVKIKVVELLINNAILKLFSEGTALYALTAPNSGQGNITSLGIDSFNITSLDIIFTGQFTTLLPINQITNPGGDNYIKISKLSTNKWIFNYVSTITHFVNYHIITA